MVALWAPAVPAQAASLEGVCARLTAAAGADKDVTAGVVLLDLASGERCEVGATREFRTASLYKTVVLAELYRQIDEGLIALTDPLILEPRHSVDDPVEFRLTAPVRTTVGEAADRMIHFSDNASALALREHLGTGLVDDAPAWLGMPDTILGSRFVSTPDDQAELYRRVYAGEVVSADASRAMFQTLAQQEIADLIPAALPSGVAIAHKTGTLDTYLHDAGIVRAPGGDFVLVVMTEHADFDAAMEVIHGVTAAAFEPFAVANPPVLAAELGALATSGRPADLPASMVAEIQAENGPAALQGAAESADGGGFDPGFAGFSAPSNPALLTMLLALAAVAIGLPAWFTRRGTPLGRLLSYGANSSVNAVAPQPASSASGADARVRADRAERGVVMRFGNRREDEERPSQVLPASRSVAEVREQPVLPSRRLQRLAEHFQAQTDLLGSMRAQFEDEMEPLQDLLTKQAHAMHRLLANLEERLRPLNEYADGEEANLVALEHRIQDGGADHVARNFAPYVEEQRRRISETRDQIDQQRTPFLQYGEQQRETVESALSRFDSDIEALEQNLAEQRRVMMRMLDAMRSETFGAVKDYLAGRQGALAQMAEAGSTDPGEIGRSVQQLRRSLEQIAGKSDYARQVLDQADQADRALISVAPGRPRAIREESPIDALDGAHDAETEEASA
jgi:beta-lactamase class A